MAASLSIGFATQAQQDLARMTQQLTDLQRQVATTKKASDLSGFGSASSELVSAQSAKSSADARNSIVTQLQSRMAVQGDALGQVAQNATSLSQSIREAVSAGDGRGIATDFGLAFQSIIQALNETWNGQPLFGGERTGTGPIKLTDPSQLIGATTPSDIFDEAQRQQQVDIGTGQPVVLSKKASEMSQSLFDTMRDLEQMISDGGGNINQPITTADQQKLIAIADKLSGQANAFTNEQGHTGQLQSRFEDESTRLSSQSDMLAQQIGTQTDADMAKVSVQINLLMTQYQASAKTFSDLSKLSLLQYL